MQEFCHSVKLLICRAWSWLAVCILKMHEFNRCLGLTTCRYCIWGAAGTPQMQEFGRCPCFSTHITWTWLCSITLQIRDFISCLLLWTSRIWTWCAALCFAALIQPMQGISVTAWPSQLALPSRGMLQEHHRCRTFVAVWYHPIAQLCTNNCIVQTGHDKILEDLRCRTSVPVWAYQLQNAVPSLALQMQEHEPLSWLLKVPYLDLTWC